MKELPFGLRGTATVTATATGKKGTGGAALVEYIVLLAFFVVTVLIALPPLGISVSDIFFAALQSGDCSTHPCFEIEEFIP